MENLSQYMSDYIKTIIGDAISNSVKNPRELLFLMRSSIVNRKNAKIRNSYEEKGIHIPPFLIASIASDCNLFCTGCYARANNSCGEHKAKTQLSAGRWGEIFNEAHDIGVSFILLAGGEPLMRNDVINVAKKNKQIIFPIFTNGTLIDEKYIELFDKNRNLVPVFSIEGGQTETDLRRGEGIYDKLIHTMERLKSKGILFGASITVTKTNIETVTNDAFLSVLNDSGCKISFFVEYVPVDEVTKDLAPTQKEREFLEEKIDLLKNKYKNMIFFAFPGDEKLVGGCLAAGRGFIHISTDGNAEPCPFSPFSDMNLKERSILDVLKSPFFEKLQKSEFLMGEHDGGCVLFSQEEQVKKMLSQ